MHVGFHLHVVDSREARRLHALTCAVPAAGLLLAAWHCVCGPVWLIASQGLWSWALAAACLIASIVLGSLACLPPRRAFKADEVKVCSLRADAQGLCVSTQERQGGQRTEDQPATVSRVLRLPGLIVMELTPTPQTGLRMPRLSVAVGRSTVSAPAWRRLNAWLIWVERGTGAM